MAVDVEGRLVVEGTGEIVETEVDLVGQLQTYARAKAAAGVLALQRQDRLAALVAEDAELKVLEQRLKEAERIVDSVEAQLQTAIPDERRVEVGQGISIDVGSVRVTWPKPAVRCTQSVKPATILSTDPELAERLGIRQTIGKPSKPRITVRADKL